MKNYILELLKDKNRSFSMRELIIVIFMAVILVSWIAQQFYNKTMPEFMFYSIISLIGAGVFGYSIEKKSSI